MEGQIGGVDSHAGLTAVYKISAVHVGDICRDVSGQGDTCSLGHRGGDADHVGKPRRMAVDP